MINVIDLIETSEPSQTKTVWTHVCGFFARQPGFIAGQLLKAYETIHPVKPYHYTSICQWESDEDWQRARKAAREDDFISRVLKSSSATFTAVKADLDQGGGHDARRSAPETMTLVDLIYVDPDRMNAYAAMWEQARAYMKDKRGFIDANLYRVSDEENPIRFVNLAVWQSPQLFHDALNTPEFMDIIDDFKSNFSLYLSRSSATLTSPAFAMS